MFGGAGDCARRLLGFDFLEAGGYGIRPYGVEQIWRRGDHWSPVLGWQVQRCRGGVSPPVGRVKILSKTIPQALRASSLYTREPWVCANIAGRVLMFGGAGDCARRLLGFDFLEAGGYGIRPYGVEQIWRRGDHWSPAFGWQAQRCRGGVSPPDCMEFCSNNWREEARVLWSAKQYAKQAGRRGRRPLPKLCVY